jgi:hypothetical protein
MIANGNPWRLKIKPKDGALYFDTNGNMLYAAEQDENGDARWIALGHVVPIDAPRCNQRIDPKVDGNPYGDSMRLLGVKG